MITITLQIYDFSEFTRGYTYRSQYNYDEVHITLAAYRKMEEIILKVLADLD